MKTELFNTLVELYNLACDETQTEFTRKEACELFEKVSTRHCDYVLACIICDTFAEAPTAAASILLTIRPAVADYVETRSFRSAAHTFFKVATTRLMNSPDIKSLSTTL